MHERFQDCPQLNRHDAERRQSPVLAFDCCSFSDRRPSAEVEEVPKRDEIVTHLGVYAPWVATSDVVTEKSFPKLINPN